MTIAVTMTVTPDLSSPDSPSPAPERREMTTAMDLTSTVGPIDNRGEYESRVLIKHIAMTAMSNGQATMQVAASIPQVDGNGPTVLFRYDDAGRMIGATVESETGFVDTAVTHAISAMLATVAPTTLSIGDTVTVPMDMKVPLAADAGSVSTQGETQLTLKSVSFDGADRIADVAVKTTTLINQYPNSASRPQTASDMPTISEGTMDVNIDRGIVLHNEEKTTIGDQPPAALMRAKPREFLRATVTVSMDLAR